MISDLEFETLLNNPESSILDFKSTHYRFSDDPDATSKLVKDIISLANTIRVDSAFIVLGVTDKGNDTKELHGIKENIDEAVLQDKVKSKVFPRPIFSFYIKKYKDRLFGVIEIPVCKYPLPISPTAKLKGLEPGKIYFRRGSSNTEAIGIEVININDWLKSLPTEKEEKSIHDEVGGFIKRLTRGDEKLSEIIADLLVIARKNSLDELIKFCSSEILGINTKDSDANPEEYRYRVIKTKVSLDKIQINPYSAIKVTEGMIKKEVDENKNFYDMPLLFNRAISEIESHLASINENTVMSSITSSSKQIFPDMDGDHPIYMYIFKDEFTCLYRNIRQKAIDKLMKV